MTPEKTYSIKQISKNSSVKKPKELVSYSRDIEGRYSVDNSQLSYYYLADNDLNSPDGVDLIGGYDKFMKNKEVDFGEFTGLLKAVQSIEEKNSKKLSTKIITWRGLMRQLMLLPFENQDRFILNVVVFDGQLFIQSDRDFAKEKFSEEEVKTDDFVKRLMYSGYKFETIATLPKPWAQCTRKEIEKRNKLIVNNIEQYATVVRTTIGNTSLVLGAEVDCAWDYKPTNSDDPLSHYVELKTTGIVDNPKSLFNFERKLLKAWAQCFLIGIPKIVYGFRDNNFSLRSVEEFKTEEIPLQFKNNPLTLQKQAQNPNIKHVNKCMHSLKFFSGLLEWIDDSIPVDDESKTYKLEFNPQINKEFIIFSENTPQKTALLLSPFNGTEGGMLTDEFRTWRHTLKAGLD